MDLMIDLQRGFDCKRRVRRQCVQRSRPLHNPNKCMHVKSPTWIPPKYCHSQKGSTQRKAGSRMLQSCSPSRQHLARALRCFYELLGTGKNVTFSIGSKPLQALGPKTLESLVPSFFSSALVACHLCFTRLYSGQCKSDTCLRLQQSLLLTLRLAGTVRALGPVQ